MGYTSSGGTKGRGSFNTTPSTTSDMNQLLALLNLHGNMMVITEAERDALAGDELYEGLLIYNTTAGMLELYDGSGWELAVPFIQSGSVTTTDEPTTGRQSLSFTFPEAFASAPILMVSSYISVSGVAVNANQSISGTTATTAVIFYTSPTNFSSGNQAVFSWLAIGAKA